MVCSILSSKMFVFQCVPSKLDTELNFQKHLNNVVSKVNETIGLLRKLQAFLPLQSSVTVYEKFIRPHLDYGDIIYDQTYDDSFHQKMESMQYKAALAITGAIRGISLKIYQKLGLESLRKRRWYRKLCYFFKIFNGQSPKYLFRMLPSISKAYNIRTNDKIPLFSGKHKFLINSFFPSTVIEQNNLDSKIRNSKTFSAFKKSILKFIKPSSNSIFNCHSSKGIRLITRLRLGLSHLRKHKFRHKFQDTPNPICICRDEIETTIHYLLHCPNYLDERRTLLDALQSSGKKIHNKNDSQISELHLFGVSSNNDTSNTFSLNDTIQYILATKRFDLRVTHS